MIEYICPDISNKLKDQYINYIIGRREEGAVIDIEPIDHSGLKITFADEAELNKFIVEQRYGVEPSLAESLVRMNAGFKKAMEPIADVARQLREALGTNLNEEDLSAIDEARKRLTFDILRTYNGQS